MRLSEVEKKARVLNIKDTWKFSKRDLIKNIQHSEGNFDCFGTAMAGYCDQQSCLWRTDCLGSK